MKQHYELTNTCFNLSLVSDVDTLDPDEKSLITYISQLYETFPEPPISHPLFTFEEQRKVAKYRELASSLSQWIQSYISVMQDRNFPGWFHSVLTFTYDKESCQGLISLFLIVMFYRHLGGSPSSNQRIAYLQSGVDSASIARKGSRLQKLQGRRAVRQKELGFAASGSASGQSGSVLDALDHVASGKGGSHLRAD